MIADRLQVKNKGVTIRNGYTLTHKSKGRTDLLIMKKTIKSFVTIATMGIMLVCAYLSGITQAETITEIQTVTATKEVIPDGYIPLNDNIVDMNTIVDFSATEYGLQLYFKDGSGYFWER